jgi:carboxyl-terminal processing protease
VPRRFIEQVLPRAPYFEGPVVVLGGSWTGSMGEGLVIGMDALGAHTIARDMGDLLGALHTFDLETCGGVLEVGAEALFHVNGTPRGDYIADHPLDAADTDSTGADPALPLALQWLAEHTSR